MKPGAIVLPWPKVLTTLSVVVLSWGVLAGDVTTVFDEPTLAPGDKVICVSDPCMVYFETPTSTGTHDIIAESGAVKAGVAIGGQRVFLGAYYPGDTVFIVEGADLPKAYLTVLDGM